MTSFQARTPVRVDQSAVVTRQVTAADVLVFADLTGDHNPVHLDEQYAARTQFGRPIAHGMFAAGLISSAIANQLPGPGTIYLSQTLKFRAPVYVGDTVTVTIRVLTVREDKPIASLSTECRTQTGTVAVEGEAVVLFRREPDQA
jgi:3-hydroxybutyryl-CoA dehydratase